MLSSLRYSNEGYIARLYNPSSEIVDCKMTVVKETCIYNLSGREYISVRFRK